MDTKDVTRHALKIEKSNNEGNYEEIMSLLTTLDEANVTVDHLQGTDIVGVLYRVLKNCPHPVVKKRVKQLLSNWKKCYSQKHGEHGKSSDGHTVEVKIRPKCLVSLSDDVIAAEGSVLIRGVSEAGSRPASTPAEGTQCVQAVRGEMTSSGGRSASSRPTRNSGPPSAPADTAPPVREESSVLRAKCVQLLLSALEPEACGGQGPEGGREPDGGREPEACGGQGPEGGREPDGGREPEACGGQGPEGGREPDGGRGPDGCGGREPEACGGREPEGCGGQERRGTTAELARSIEEHIHALHGASQARYKACVRSKVANLRNPRNGHLRRGLLSGSLGPGAFARMSVLEMAGEELRRLRAGYSSRGVSERQLPAGPGGTPTRKLRCTRCGGADCTVSQVARGTLFLPAWVRRGDPGEDAMTFVTCGGCGAQWYHSGWVCL